MYQHTAFRPYEFSYLFIQRENYNSSLNERLLGVIRILLLRCEKYGVQNLSRKHWCYNHNSIELSNHILLKYLEVKMCKVTTHKYHFYRKQRFMLTISHPFHISLRPSEECGWDGGDCFPPEYPDCLVLSIDYWRRNL